MQGVCNSWRVRNLLVMVLRLNNSLKLAESIVSLHPHLTTQAQHPHSSHSTVNTPFLGRGQQCRRRPLPEAPTSHAERSSPQTAGESNITNNTILNTFKLHARRIWLCAVRPNTLNLPCVVLSTLTMIQSNTGMDFPTSNSLKTSQTRGLSHRHPFCRGQEPTPAPVLRWAITLLNHGNPTPRIALRQTYISIHNTH